MFVGFLIGAIFYGAMTLVFLILSSAELLENCMSTPSRLARVFVISIFWPMSLVLLSLIFAFTRYGRLLHRLGERPVFRLSHGAS
ncbi:hypothetical protein [uncultured Roseibium sp.]|uniref:hypothetical protein n=2 Tax=uncultured Roseibium sp. TaxID=1936171 RepID=UPI002615DCC5|nr:hypothetical protein [uncultured Roseibium sp.]